MKKLPLLLTIFIFLFFAFEVFAISIVNPIKCENVPCLINSIASLIFYVALATVPLIVIIAGILFIFSGGDPNKTTQARNLLFWAGIGLAILLLAKTISSVVETFLEG